MGNPLRNEIGNTYGHLTVTAFKSFDKGGQARWVAWCKLCEESFTILGSNLRRKIKGVKGCKGCRGLKSRSPETKFYHAYKNGALQRDLAFRISLDEFNVLIRGNCHYCGSTPSMAIPIKYIKNCHYNGIDRVDSSLGYESGNCVSCCSTCNYAKRKMSKDKFLEWVKKVFLYQEFLTNEGSLQESVGRAG